MKGTSWLLRTASAFAHIERSMKAAPVQPGVLYPPQQRSGFTGLLVTHDVDEALLLSDRVVVLSKGPAARVTATLDIPFVRPRDREAILALPEYLHLRHEILSMLLTEAEAAA